MKTISLRVSDDSYEKIISFLELIPKEKIQIFKTEIDIEFVSDEEQEEISKILNDPSCHEISGYEKILQI
jgi:hypothetical protein